MSLLPLHSDMYNPREPNTISSERQNKKKRRRSGIFVIAWSCRAWVVPLMAGGWMKSWQCKSRAHEDAFDPKNFNHQMATSSCRKSYQSLKDVIETTKQQQPKPRKSTSSSSKKLVSSSSRHHPRTFLPDPDPIFTNRIRVRISQDSVFPTLAELPEGHPSRNVVEIIFHTSWGSKAFSGRVEMIFKVQNLGRTAARFEEYREVVKARSGSRSVIEDDARCMADGNEVMRFHCLGASSAEAGCGGAWAFSGGKGKPVCTFSGSGAAHECAGGGRGRRAMLVCRVIAGRVEKRIGVESLLEGRVGYDSVSGENGELLVSDSRAVLPCFLIIYKL